MAEDSDKKTQVSTKAIVFNPEGKMLVLFRTETAPSYPNHWDLPGGELEYGESLEQAVSREVQEESSLEIEDLQIFHAESDMFTNGFWVTIVFRATAKNENVKISWEHGDFKWVTPQEFLELQAVPRQQNFVKKLLDRT